MDGWNTTFLLGRPIFRGYVSFREGMANPYDKYEKTDSMTEGLQSRTPLRLTRERAEQRGLERMAVMATSKPVWGL